MEETNILSFSDEQNKCVPNSLKSRTDAKTTQSDRQHLSTFGSTFQ